MLEGARIAVVVPAFNVEAWIERVVSTMPAFVDSIVIIDDGSLDRTRERTFAMKDSRVEPIFHEQNRGVGAAIVSGYRRAQELGADVIAVMAGDAQMDPDDLRTVVLPVVRGQVAYVKGTRMESPTKMPFLRRQGTRFFGALTAWAIAQGPVTDAQCGFTAISRRGLEALDLSAIWPRYGYPNDLLGAIAFAGLSFCEVPVRAVYTGQSSGLRPWHFLVVCFLVLRVRMRRYRLRIAEDTCETNA